MTAGHDKLMKVIEVQDLIRELWVDEKNPGLEQDFRRLDKRLTHIINAMGKERDLMDKDKVMKYFRSDHLKYEMSYSERCEVIQKCAEFSGILTREVAKAINKFEAI